MDKFNSGVFFTYMVVSGAVGAFASLILILVDDILVLPLIFTILVGSGITAIIAAVAYLPILLKLRIVTERLASINTRKRTETIKPLPFGILGKLVKETNTIVENQTDFQTMRGRLYEQISEVAAQEERNRLARDLHDSIKQQVFSMSVSATAAHVHLETNPDAARNALNDVRQSAQEAMVEMRVLLQQLAPAPLEQSGLVESIKHQLEALSFRTGAKISSDFDTLPNNELLPIGAQETLFRITQEALSNIARHARAHHVHLSLTNDADTQQVILTITDDGQGFDMDNIQRGMGLNNMERRVEDLNATIDLSSVKGEGTSLIATIPLEIEDIQSSLLEERAENKKLAERVYQYYIALACIIGGIIFATTLIVRSIVSDSSPFIISVMWALLIACLLGLRTVWGRYQERRTAYRQSVPSDDPSRVLIKQHNNEALWIICIAFSFVVPSGLVGIEGYLWLPSLIGILILLVLGGTMVNILRHLDSYLRQLYPSEFNETMKTLRVSLLTGIATTVFIAATVFLPSTGQGFYMFPETTEQWDSNFFTSMVMMFTTYHIALSIFYIYW
ncbi:MAG: sensor histidine kinase, partial [Chloroflexota bacterium]